MLQWQQMQFTMRRRHFQMVFCQKHHALDTSHTSQALSAPNGIHHEDKAFPDRVLYGLYGVSSKASRHHKHDASVAPNGIHHEDKAFPGGVLSKASCLWHVRPQMEFTMRTSHFQMVFWHVPRVKSIWPQMEFTMRTRHLMLLTPPGVKST